MLYMTNGSERLPKHVHRMDTVRYQYVHIPKSKDQLYLKMSPENLVFVTTTFFSISFRMAVSDTKRTSII
jgi:hypothetical protein